MQDFRAQGCEFQHFLKGDFVELACLFADTRVGGVDAVHVGIDVATLCTKGGGKGHSGRVRSATSQCGDASFWADALEACDNRDLHAFGELRIDIVVRDLFDPGCRMRRGGFDRNLPALPAARRNIHLLQCQSHKARGHILARADDRIVFTRVIKRRGLVDPAHQLVGFARHGRDDDDDVIALCHLNAHAFGCAADAVQVRDRGAAEFHYQSGHRRLVLTFVFQIAARFTQSRLRKQPAAVRFSGAVGARFRKKYRRGGALAAIGCGKSNLAEFSCAVGRDAESPSRGDPHRQRF